MNMKRLFSAFGIAALTAVAATPALAATTYKLEFAPGLIAPGPFYFFSTQDVNGINASGTVVTTAVADGVDGGSDTFAALWDTAGNYTGLTTPYLAPYGSRGVAINKSGQALTTEGGDIYVVSNGTRSIVQTGLLQPYPTSMNDAGTIVGRYPITVNGAPQYHAFVFTNGLATDLGTLPGAINSSARDVNNLGHVVGGALISPTAGRAVLWRDGAISDLGTLPGDTSSTAIAINDKGQIIGTSSGAAGTRGFIWQNGVMTDLGAFGTNKLIEPRDINNAGQIVGVARLNSTSTIYDYGIAFAWSNGVYKNINSLVGQTGLYGCGAYAVSDAGHIAGRCGTGDLTYRLTPVPDAVDVSMEMSTAPTTNARQNDPLVYTMRVVNTGSLPASGIAVIDTLPTSVTFVSATTTQGSCSGAATVTCSIGDLAPGADATVTITVIPTQTMVFALLANTAAVTLNETDVSPANNSSTVYIDVQAAIVYADLGVTMVASPTKVKRGQFATYTMTVTNSGPQSAQGVVLSDKFPPGFSSLKSTQGTCSGPGYINTSTASCSIGTLLSGAKATVTLTIKPQTTGTYTNTATVSSAANDSNAANNTASASVIVVR